MVARAGGHYGEPFHIERSITKEGLIYPIIFNVVVYMVVRHWYSLVAERVVGEISDDDGNMAQLEGRTTWERGYGRRRAKEERAKMMLRADLFMWKIYWWLTLTHG